MTIHALLPVVALITTLDLTPPPAQAAGWQAWHGCWEVLGDGAPADALVCALPGSSAAEIRLISVTGSVVGEETVVRADGTPRAIEDGGCSGTETARWSRDGRRVFIRSELDCDSYRRIGSGIIAMTSEREWVDVRAATIFDQHVARTLRYRQVSPDRAPASIRAQLDEARPMVYETARVVAAAPLGIDEILEASAEMPGPALQAFLAARGSAPVLNGRQILQLADAGVAPEVIEVMVALAHPQHFNIRQPAVEVPQRADAQRYGARADECYDPWLGRYVYGTDCQWRYGYGRSGYNRYNPWDPYSPYGYRGWGGWPVGGGTIVIVEPREPERQGGLIRGQGYTRGSSTDSRGTAQPRSGAPASDRSSAGSSSSGSTSSGSTSSGSSSTGSSTSTGRTAVPRGGGGGL